MKRIFRLSGVRNLREAYLSSVWLLICIQSTHQPRDRHAHAMHRDRHKHVVTMAAAIPNPSHPRRPHPRRSRCHQCHRFSSFPALVCAVVVVVVTVTFSHQRLDEKTMFVGVHAWAPPPSITTSLHQRQELRHRPTFFAPSLHSLTAIPPNGIISSRRIKETTFNQLHRSSWNDYQYQTTTTLSFSLRDDDDGRGGGGGGVHHSDNNSSDNDDESSSWIQLPNLLTPPQLPTLPTPSSSFQKDGRPQDITSSTFGPYLLPLADAVDNATGGWGLSYADLSPQTPRSPAGIAFLATNVLYGAVGVTLSMNGDVFYGTLTELAGLVSFAYHYAQLELGAGRGEVRLALLIDYLTAGSALIVGGIYMVQSGLEYLPASVIFSGLGAIVCLSLCWVWEYGLPYILWHSLWHILSAYTAYLVGQVHLGV